MLAAAWLVLTRLVVDLYELTCPGLSCAEGCGASSSQISTRPQKPADTLFSGVAEALGKAPQALQLGLTVPGSVSAAALQLHLRDAALCSLHEVVGIEREPARHAAGCQLSSDEH